MSVYWQTMRNIPLDIVRVIAKHMSADRLNQILRQDFINYVALTKPEFKCSHCNSNANYVFRLDHVNTQCTHTSHRNALMQSYVITSCNKCIERYKQTGFIFNHIKDRLKGSIRYIDSSCSACSCSCKVQEVFDGVHLISWYLIVVYTNCYKTKFRIDKSSVLI